MDIALKRGDFVAKLGGDYIFKGRVAAVFDKLGGEGAQRVVVQNGDGVLMIMNPGQLHKYSDPVQDIVHAADAKSAEFGAMMTRKTYEQISIIEKLAFWAQLKRGTMFDESWTGNWNEYVSEVCQLARNHILEGLIAPLVERIEDEYANRIEADVGRKAFAVTGEEYVEITSLIDFDALQDVEGRRHSANFKLYDIPQEAIDAASTNFNLYENWCIGRNSFGSRLRLYWRMKPEIDIFEGKWKVYMRCLLSAKPPLDAQSLSLLLSKKSSSLTSVSFR